MKIYISGPMTGLPENNYPAFHEAARTLRAKGHKVVNPAEIHPHGWLRRLLHRVLRVLRLVRGKQLAPTWADYMRADIRALLDCEAIALLPGWDQSRGARCEVSIAEDLGMRRVEIGGKQGCEWCGGTGRVSWEAGGHIVEEPCSCTEDGLS